MDLLEISKSISYYLRHNPEEIDILLDKEGWTDLNIFLNKISNKLGKKIDLTILNEILKKSDKKRFEIKNGKIMTMYGHSLKTLDIKYEEYKGSKDLYHGTQEKKLDSILMEGLKGISRNYVHLSDDIVTASNTAKRYGKDIVILRLKTNDFLKNNFKIFYAGNGVYLAKSILPKYLEIMKS